MSNATKKKSRRAKTLEMKDLGSAKSPEDPKGGLNFANQGLLPAVQTASITDGTSNTILLAEKVIK